MLVACPAHTKTDRGSQDSLLSLCRAGLRTVYLLFLYEEDVLMVFYMFFSEWLVVRLAPCSEPKGEHSSPYMHTTQYSIEVLGNAIPGPHHETRIVASQPKVQHLSKNTCERITVLFLTSYYYVAS